MKQSEEEETEEEEEELCFPEVKFGSSPLAFSRGYEEEPSSGEAAREQTVLLTHSAEHCGVVTSQLLGRSLPESRKNLKSVRHSGSPMSSEPCMSWFSHV